MADLIIRTSNPRTEGGDLSDIQISYTVEALDPDGNVLYRDVLWLSSKGLDHDPATAAKVSQEAAESWAAANADQIDAGARKLTEKAHEIETARPLLDAIAATPDVVKTRAELGVAVSGRVGAEAGAGEIVTTARLVVRP